LGVSDKNRLCSTVLFIRIIFNMWLLCGGSSYVRQTGTKMVEIGIATRISQLKAGQKYEWKMVNSFKMIGEGKGNILIFSSWSVHVI
jgi:hypothetical protein